MQHVHRSRKNALAARRHKPLLCELDVPQEFGEGHANSSERPHLGTFQYSLAPPGVQPNAMPNAISSALPQAQAVRGNTSTKAPLPDTLTMSRLGAGQGDPFLRYPIKITHRSKEFVDTSQSCPCGLVF